MKIKSGNDEIDINEINVDLLHSIPVGKCMRQKIKMGLDGDIIETSVSICRIDENRWNIKGSMDFGDDEEGFTVDGEIVVD